MSPSDRDKWLRIQRDLIEGMRRVGVGLRPAIIEINRGAAKFADATWPMRYADDVCEPEEDVFV